MPSLSIGTSGWRYDGWKGSFYQGVPRKRWLEHYATVFSAVEVDATFYRLQREDTLADWKRRTPPGFRFAIKGHRYITHNKRLKDPEEAVIRSRDNARPLGSKLRVVLWQLPAAARKNLPRLEAFARALARWGSARHALELRHPSWFDEEVAGCLSRHRLAVCLSDAPDWPLWDAVTTDLVYVRLHGHTRTYASSYSRPLLERWADRVGQWLREDREVHVYFDNDAEGAAPGNAVTLAELVTARRSGEPDR